MRNTEAVDANVSKNYIQAQNISRLEKEGMSYGQLGNWLTAFVLFIASFLSAPKIGLAEENYFQIINGSIRAVNQDFVQDRGYAIYVSYDGKRFLMDTGIKEKNFARNLKAAEILLDDLDFVFLSHAHRDHIGGAFHIRRERPSLPVYIPPGGGFIAPEFIEVHDHLSISPNIILVHTHDDNGSGNIKDELSLLIKTSKGPYLFTSNSHTDFFVKLAKAKQLAAQDIFFHSGHTARRVSSEKTIMDNAKKMKNLNVRQASPSHSDPRHDKIFEEVFGANYVEATLGKKVPLDPVSE
jgi:metal-dependent hydrolase (beta-lactamase superfamily II)